MASMLRTTLISLPWRVLLPLHLLAAVLLRYASWYGNTHGIFRRGMKTGAGGGRGGGDADDTTSKMRRTKVDWDYRPPADVCQSIINSTIPDDQWFRDQHGGIAGPLLQRYTLLHRSILCDPAPLTSKRVLIHHGIGGLGNQMQGILSSLLLAVLTDRALLTTHSSGGCNFLGELFSPANGALHTTLSPSLARSLWLGQVPRAVFDDVTDPLRVPSLTCDDLASKRYGKVIAIEIHSAEYLAPLWEHGYFKSKLHALGLDKGAWVQPFARYLFHPSDAVRNAMATEVDFKCDVGVHIRRGLLGRAKEKGIKAHPEMITPWLGCLGRALSNRPNATLDILVASDHLRAVKEVRQWQLSRVKSTNGDGVDASINGIWSLMESTQDKKRTMAARSRSGYIADSGRSSSTQHKCSAVTVMAAAELLMLASCNTLVTTSRSSFSMMATALSSINPFVVSIVDIESGKPTLSELHQKDQMRNGCIKQSFSTPIYSELNHLVNLPCVKQSEILQELSDPGPCDLGYCGGICQYHGSHLQFPMAIFIVMSWHQCFVFQLLCIMGATVLAVTFDLRICLGVQSRLALRWGRSEKGNIRLNKGQTTAILSLSLALMIIIVVGVTRFSLYGRRDMQRGYIKVEREMLNMDSNHKKYALNKH